MLLDFDIKKAIAATAYIVDHDGGKSDMFLLIKKLYMADRGALIAWGKSITGDKLACLEKGPVVSGIYDLLKQKGPHEHQVLWDDAIHRANFSITLRKHPGLGPLSQREIVELEKARLTINSIKGSIPAWLHRHCPEWKDPGRSMLPIDPSVILRNAKKSEAEIRQIEEANEEIRLLNRMLAG